EKNYYTYAKRDTPTRGTSWLYEQTIASKKIEHAAPTGPFSCSKRLLFAGFSLQESFLLHSAAESLDLNPQSQADALLRKLRLHGDLIHDHPLLLVTFDFE
ncbi:MAG TPA: hypothetical protein VN457_01655, partial [Chlamydiales bacterium]|nr:hypothetical protein [Chlamydiales bacterium]